MPRHILIKLARLNTKNIKSSKEEATSNIQGKPICLTADLSAETLQARREWQDIFKVLKGKNLPGKEKCTWQESHSNLMEK